VQVSQQPGGVARNIADALSRLIPPRSLKLVSVVGKDAAGSALLRLWDNHNERSTSGILVRASSRTATVSTVMTGNEIYAGIADTGALGGSDLLLLQTDSLPS
jgi:sugar/nucleoside kinase (ribokinase family)